MTSSTDVTEDQTADWTVLEDQRVLDAIEMAVRNVAPRVDGVHTADDLHQEASIIGAITANVVNEYLADKLFGERALCRWFINHLMNATRTEMRHAEKLIPLQVLAERAGE